MPRWIFLSLLLILASGCGPTDAPVDAADASDVAPPERYDADRAMGYLRRLCEFGPRPTGSEAMTAQRDYLAAFFRRGGGEVREQRFEIRHPRTGDPVPVVNLIASWGVDRPNRYLLCAHYDTRPYPDQDRNDPRGVFIGANDGASGTATLMELSHQFATLPDDVGVDVVLFDAEELVYGPDDDYFIGSTYFAQDYLCRLPPVPYAAGILLDMVGDADLRLFYERNSLRLAPEVTRGLWRTASDLGVREFVARPRHEIRDDHLPLNRIAGIPTVDVIDFDYPHPGHRESYWHTVEDTPEKCSGRSLAKVVWVVDEYLRRQSRLPTAD